MGKHVVLAAFVGIIVGASSGCATVSSASGAGGAEVVSGDTQSLSALSGGAGDNIATSGSNTTGQAVASDAKPNQPVLPGENNTVAPR